MRRMLLVLFSNGDYWYDVPANYPVDFRARQLSDYAVAIENVATDVNLFNPDGVLTNLAEQQV